MTTPIAPRSYASLLRRYQALILDGVIYLFALVIGLFGPAMLDLETQGTRLMFGAFLAFWALYEPLLVGIRAGTVGHYHYRIRVVDAQTGGPIGVLRALGRGVLKGTLGLLSLIFMLVTSRAQSLHDLAFRTLVVPASPTTALPIDMIVPGVVPESTLPSRARRFLVIAGYSAATLFLLQAGVALLLSSNCLSGYGCTSADRLLADATGFLWLAATTGWLILGWRGRLWGCRRRDLPELVG